MLSRATGKIRIIGGKWRSRKINFPQIPGLRPTHDRIRETLFNWLMSDIEGANCLDLFAGSGALGFEALSRGAKHVTFIDNSPKVISALKQNVVTLEAASMVNIIQTECPSVMHLKQAPFHIVFLDPPFYQGLLAPTLEWLEENRYIKPGALIYVEAEKTLTTLPIPNDWEVFKQKKTASVSYALLKCH